MCSHFYGKARGFCLTILSFPLFRFFLLEKVKIKETSLFGYNCHYKPNMTNYIYYIICTFSPQGRKLFFSIMTLNFGCQTPEKCNYITAFQKDTMSLLTIGTDYDQVQGR